MKTVKDLQNLQNRIVLITGANGNLGRVFADSLAQLGASLVLVDHPKSDMNNLSNEIKKKWNVNVWQFKCDLKDEKSRIELIKFVSNEIGSLNCIINNAAFTGADNLIGWSCGFEEQSLETWRQAFEVNLTAVFHLSQSFTPLLRVAAGANIVNISSIYGEFAPDWSLYEGLPMGNPAAYACSKAGLMQLSRWLATTLAPEVRVNTIAPGGICRNQPDIFVQRYVKKTPMQRMASEEDFRGAITFLVTDMSAYMTGQTLFIDGGWSIW
jgi:NAD(P)-dependent dehydrogenase (short-subunit alcohol dehydrogenase family)